MPNSRGNTDSAAKVHTRGLSDRPHFPNAVHTACFWPLGECGVHSKHQLCLAWEWEKLTYHHDLMLLFIASVRQNGNDGRRDEDAIQSMNNTI